MTSVVVHEDMMVKTFLDSAFLQKKMYGHVMELDTISRLTAVSNILAFCKNLCDDLQYKSMKNNSCIDLAISALKQYRMMTKLMMTVQVHASIFFSLSSSN